MKRIVLVIGGIETLEYFSYQMGKAFEKGGYQVFYYDLKNEIKSGRSLRKFVRTGETVLITFNFEGLEKEPGVYKAGVGYIWDEYQMPCFNIAADHPYYYHNRLVDLPKQYYHISIDRGHERYFKEFYPEYHSLGFLPLAGTGIWDEDMLAQQNLSEIDKTMEVIFTGNYTPPSFFATYMQNFDEEYAAFYQGIIDELIAEPQKTVEEVASAHCKKALGEVSKADLRLVLHKMIFIDLYVRNYWRGQVVKTLVDAGILVDVFGKGWEELDCQKPENLHIHPQITSLECLRQIKQAKVSLNVMPWFKDGAHDRVFNSILNGTVCVTDKSKYLCEELSEGEGVVYFDLENLNQLPEMIFELLANEKTRQRIWKKGLEKVKEHHTWEARAKKIIEMFDLVNDKTHVE